MDEDIGESGELLFVLQQLGQIVSDGLCVVIVNVSHPHSTRGPLSSQELCLSLGMTDDGDALCHCYVCLCLTQSSSATQLQLRAQCSCLSLQAGPAHGAPRQARGHQQVQRWVPACPELSCTYHGWPENTRNMIICQALTNKALVIRHST